MTENKEIIINGVDVSGCDFYDKIKKYCLTLKMDTTGFKNPSCFSGDFQKCIQDSKVCPNTFCDNNPNCYYKQLKRKEQECEESKELSKLLEEQMKFNKCELELSLSSEIKRSEFLLKEFKKADKQRDNWREKAEKLKQTIAEIKEIAESNMDDKQIVAVQIMLNGSPDPKNEVLKQIIQKCEEVNKQERIKNERN